jgi:hypothetical protein
VTFIRKFLKYFVSAGFVSLVLGVFGLYYTVRGSRTHLSMDIAAESNVLDVKHSVPDLAILFQGRDIEEEKSNLKVLTVRVVNDGEANIRENDFDSRMPFGLEIDNGRVIRAQVVSANSPYLASNLHPRVEGGNRIFMDKIIFDKGKFVAVEVLVLHRKSSNPQLKPMGKIAGLDDIAVTNSFQERDQRSFLDQVFNGPAAVQISRGLGYSFGALITIIVVGFSIVGIASIPSSIKKRQRRRIASRFAVLEVPEQEKKRKAIEEVFVEHGLPGLTRAQRLLGNEAALREEMSARRAFYVGSLALDLTKEELDEIPRHSAELAVPSSLSPLVYAKLICLERDELKVDADVKPLLADFIAKVSGEDDNPVEPPAG